MMPDPPAQAAVVALRRRSAPASVLVALVPLAFILFFVVSQGIAVAQPRLLHAHAEAGRANPAAAWRNAIVGTLILTRPRRAVGDPDRRS